MLNLLLTPVYFLLSLVLRLVYFPISLYCRLFHRDDLQIVLQAIDANTVVVQRYMHDESKRETFILLLSKPSSGELCDTILAVLRRDGFESSSFAPHKKMLIFPCYSSALDANYATWVGKYDIEDSAETAAAYLHFFLKRHPNDYADVIKNAFTHEGLGDAVLMFGYLLREASEGNSEAMVKDSTRLSNSSCEMLEGMLLRKLKRPVRVINYLPDLGKYMTELLKYAQMGDEYIHGSEKYHLGALDGANYSDGAFNFCVVPVAVNVDIASSFGADEFTDMLETVANDSKLTDAEGEAFIKSLPPEAQESMAFRYKHLVDAVQMSLVYFINSIAMSGFVTVQYDE